MHWTSRTNTSELHIDALSKMRSSIRKKLDESLEPFAANPFEHATKEISVSHLANERYRSVTKARNNRYRPVTMTCKIR